MTAGGDIGLPIGGEAAKERLCVLLLLNVLV
jgi:hypothetical protein